MMRSVVVPTKEDIDRVVRLATTVGVCVVTVKIVSTLVNIAKEERQNKKIKQLKKKVEELEDRVKELEDNQLVSE